MQGVSVCIRERVCVWVCVNEEGSVLKTLGGAWLLSDSTRLDNNTLAALCVYRSNSKLLHNHFLDRVLLILPTLASACLLLACCQTAGQPACLPLCLPSQADVNWAAMRFIKREGKQENKNWAPRVVWTEVSQSDQLQGNQAHQRVGR